MRFLLDANLSPRVGRFLATTLQLDIVSLHGLRLGHLPDHEIIRLARRQERVIITLDRDFAEYFFRTTRPDIGIIYLDLPNRVRFIPRINDVLFRFFTRQAANIDLESCLVNLTESEVRIIHAPVAPDSPSTRENESHD